MKKEIKKPLIITLSILSLIVILLFINCILPSLSKWTFNENLDQLPNRLYSNIYRDGDCIYYINSNKSSMLRRKSIDGTHDTSLKTKASNIIGVENNLVYYTNCEGEIHKINTDGTKDKKIFGNDRNLKENISGTLIKDGWIYFTRDRNEICRIRTDGIGEKKILNETFYLYDIASDGWIYYIEYFKRTLNKVRIDGSEKKIITDIPKGTFPGISRFQVLDNYIYYIYSEHQKGNSDVNAYSYYLYKVNKDGKNPILIYENFIDNFFVKNDTIYFTTRDSLSKMNLDGSNITCIYKTNGMVQDIQVSEEWIYYKNKNEHDLHIYGLKLDRSSKAPIIIK